MNCDNENVSDPADRIISRTTIDCAISEAENAILAGKLVAAPTETVYGLAADATNDRAVARIFEAKGRPQFNPLIVHFESALAAGKQVEFSPLAETLAHHFWPGPLTLVLPRRADSTISLLASAGLDTLGVRAPDHAITQALIKSCGRPLAAPSANRSGTISPTRAEHVREGLGDKVDMILDGGPCPVGVESTILKIEGDDAILLRPGGVSVEEIERAVGRRMSRSSTSSPIEAPGMLASHYAPNARLRINVELPEANEAYMAFGPNAVSRPHTLNLSTDGDLREAAANLFAHLRRLDQMCAVNALSGIAAAPVPETGLGEAINDRLVRAAAAR